MLKKHFGLLSMLKTASYVSSFFSGFFDEWKVQKNSIELK